MKFCVWPLLFANKSASMADAFSLTTAREILGDGTAYTPNR